MYVLCQGFLVLFSRLKVSLYRGDNMLGSAYSFMCELSYSARDAHEIDIQQAIDQGHNDFVRQLLNTDILVRSRSGFDNVPQYTYHVSSSSLATRDTYSWTYHKLITDIAEPSNPLLRPSRPL